MASGGLTCIKYITFICNLLFALTGILILSVGAMVQFNYAHYSKFVSDHIWTAPIILMIVGAIIAFICFLGCCGALKENSCMILSFAILAVVVFFVEIGLGIAGYIKHVGLQQIMEVQFNNTMKYYNERKDYRDGWTLVQTELDCCGTYGPNDWEAIFPNKTIPSSCCPVINLNEAEVCTVAHANSTGCFHKLLELLDSNTLVLAGVVLAVAVIQDHLLKTYEIINHISHVSSTQDENDNITFSEYSNSLEITPSTSNAAYSKLAQHINLLVNTSNSTATNQNYHIKAELLAICEKTMEPLETNVLEYWKKISQHSLKLTQLAEVVLAVPATQVSVERAFSALATVLTKLRSKLSKKSLSNILITKLNFDLLDCSALKI